MARGQLIVETSQVTTAAQRVDNLANDYEAEYKNLFETVHGMKAVYDSADSAAFIEQIEGFRNDYEKMTQLMRDYASFLRKTALEIERTSDDIRNRAKTLSQGS